MISMLWLLYSIGYLAQPDCGYFLPEHSNTMIKKQLCEVLRGSNYEDNKAIVLPNKIILSFILILLPCLFYYKLIL